MAFRNPLLLSLILCGPFAPFAAAQGTPKDKDPVKKDMGKPADPPKAPLTLDQLKLSPGTVVVIVDEFKDLLSLIPRMTWILPEDYQAMKDRIQALEKMVKVDRKLPSVCKLTGRLDGDTVHLRGEFQFSTEAPRAAVFLGLQGGVLTDEGELDRAPPHLEAVEDGYVVRVEKPGNHHLTLSLVVPVGTKRAGITGGSAERTLDLGLPGAAVTTLNLELPPGVKELRWNERAEKRRGSRWELALGKEKALALSWREPVARPESGPLRVAEAQVLVRIEDKQIHWSADLTLEDLQGQTREWQLLFPTEARVEIKSAGATGYTLRFVEGKAYTHLLELSEPGSERWVLHIQFSQARPEPGALMPVGPLQVLGASRQQGTITIQSAPDALRGQRLVFHRSGDTLQRDPPRSGTALAVFQYWSLTPAKKGPKGLARAPLELELKEGMAKGEAEMDHQFHLHREGAHKVLNLTTRIKLRVGPPGLRYLYIQVPRPSTPVLPGALVEPFLYFPGGVIWSGLFKEGPDPEQANPGQFSLEGDPALVRWEPPDPQGRIKIEFLGSGNILPDVVLTGSYALRPDPGRVRIFLPRPLGLEEKKVEVEVRGEEGTEFTWQRPGKVEPAQAPQHFQESYKGGLESLEFSWGEYRPEVPAAAQVKVDLFDSRAEVVMHLNFLSAVKKGSLSGEALLDFPPELAGRKVTREDRGPGEVILKYALPLGPPGVRLPGPGEAPIRLRLAFPWPKGTTRKKVQLKVWADGGTAVELDENDRATDAWQEEADEGKAYPPNLSVSHPGPEPALTLVLRPDKGPHLRVDRALIRVKVDGQGNHEYRAQYLVRSIHVRQLKLKLPVNPSALLEKEEVLLDGAVVKTTEDRLDLIRIPVERRYYKSPVILEVRFKVRAAEREGKWAWGTTFTPPHWADARQVVLGRVRWQVSLPGNRFVLPASAGVRSEYAWGLTGWLLGPVPAAASTELETWMTDREPVEPEEPVSLVLDQIDLDALTVFHFARPVWLLLCSGTVLLLGLGVMLLSIPRLVLWGLTLLLAGGIVALAWFWPSLLGGLVFGCQPGLLVLGLLLLVQWLLQKSYHRQVVFLPGFTRLKPGSSLTRAVGLKPEREPSTVDAPTPSGVGKPSTSHGS